MKILVTGGTVFVSKNVAIYFRDKGDEVFVLNRDSKEQIEGVSLIKADRHNLKDELKYIHFDVIIDVTAYNEYDVDKLLDGLGEFDKYIMVSSSAVYSDSEQMPFTEITKCGPNSYWGNYGVDKKAGEDALFKRVPDAYVVRPPYLYGPMENLYREPFVFECAIKDREFYLPKDGDMKLQFFHVRDLCKFFEIIINESPKEHIFNVGNEKCVSIKEWADICYKVIGKKAEFKNVYNVDNQRRYFCFTDYEYQLDVSLQNKYLDKTIDLEQGMKESYEWYLEHPEDSRANREGKNYIEFLDNL